MATRIQRFTFLSSLKFEMLTCVKLLNSSRFWWVSIFKFPRDNNFSIHKNGWQKTIENWQAITEVTYGAPDCSWTIGGLFRKDENIWHLEGWINPSSRENIPSKTELVLFTRRRKVHDLRRSSMSGISVSPLKPKWNILHYLCTPN